jgi:hypothetical protein
MFSTTAITVAITAALVVATDAKFSLSEYAKSINQK